MRCGKGSLVFLLERGVADCEWQGNLREKRGKLPLGESPASPYIPRRSVFRFRVSWGAAVFMSRWAVFLPNWIGDVAMATPALRALREHLGSGAEIVGVIRPYIRDVLAGTSWCDELLTYEKGLMAGATGWWNLVRELRQRKLDGALLLTNSFSTALLAWAGNAKQRIGNDRHWRGGLLTRVVRAPREKGKYAPISAVDYYLSITGAMGAKSSQKELALATLAKDDDAADRVWKKLRIGSDRVIALNPGAAYGSAKHWPVEHYAKLAQLLVVAYSARVLVLCGPAEREAAQEIVRLSGSAGVASLADETLGVGLTKGVLKRCSALVSTDSGPRHLAAGFDVPTIALFGPTDPRWSHNYNPREIQLRLGLECSPCARRHCPLGHHQCMRDLSPEMVLSALRTLLETAPSRAA